jgi:hypothetical protein
MAGIGASMSFERGLATNRSPPAWRHSLTSPSFVERPRTKAPMIRPDAAGERRYAH